MINIVINYNMQIRPLFIPFMNLFFFSGARVAVNDSPGSVWHCYREPRALVMTLCRLPCVISEILGKVVETVAAQDASGVGIIGSRVGDTASAFFFRMASNSALDSTGATR